MRDAAKLADDYIALWNETDQSRRMSMLATTWTASATYVDPLMQGRGHREIDGLIAGAQVKFPDFRFSLLKLQTGSATTSGSHGVWGPRQGNRI